MPTNHTAPAASGSTQHARGFPLNHALFWLLVLASAHIVLRVSISSALKWDEAEQLLWSQQLAWGYGAQPPLYTWLQWIVNQFFGPGVLALSVLKHTLLVLTYVLFWQAAREFLDRRGAWWAAASVMLLPALGWRSITDLTHTVLLMVFVAAAWLALVRLVRRPHPLTFAALGGICALGMLAKYSFALIAAAMLLAALSEPTTRRALLSKGWWWAPLVGAVLVLPHALWVVAHWQQATALTLSKMQGTHPGIATTLLDLSRDLLTNLFLFALFAFAAFGKAWWRRPLTPASPWALRLFTRYLLFIVMALVGMAIFGGVEVFKARWIAPMLCIVPLAAFCARPELQKHAHGPRYTRSLVFVALLILLAAGMQPWVSSMRGHAGRLAFPIVALEQALRDAGYNGSAPIIASDHLLAGMLKARFPRAPVVACNFPIGTDTTDCVAATAQDAQSAHGGLLVTCSDDTADPWWKYAWAGLPGEAKAQPSQVVDLPYRMTSRQETPRVQCRYKSWRKP